MRLLDVVRYWDEKYIVCSAVSHRDRANPLRDRGYLSNVHGLEYAAQAMAVHGSLLIDSGDDDKANLTLVYVAAFRNVDIAPGALDGAEGDALTIRAEQHASVPGGWSYDFLVESDKQLIVRGRATVVAPGASA